MRFSFGIGIGVFVALAILEILFQFVPVQSGARMAGTSVVKPFARYLPRQGYDYSYGWSLLNAKHGVSNDQGFTNSPDFDGQKGVLVVGDSYIESLMLEFKDTVQGRLSLAMGGNVRAASASANGLADSLRIAEYYLPVLRPKSVVFFVEPYDLSTLMAPPGRGHNGFVENGDAISVVHSPYQESRLKQQLQRSALARYIYYNLKFSEWLTKTVRFNQEHDLDVEIGRGALATKERMLRYYFSELRLQSIAGGHQVFFLLDGDRKMLYSNKVSQRPAWNGEDRALFIRLAPMYGHKVVDMQPVFERHWAQRQERMDYLPVDGHWNPVAHKLAADELLKQLPE